MIIPAGYRALDMIGFTDKGTYSVSTEYVKNDLVHYSGNIWRCLVDETTGITPAEGARWTLFIGEPTNLTERIIAPIETSPTQQAWAVGRQFIYNDLLYEVIDAIAIGDSLVAYESDPSNANIKLALPVETQLLNLKALDENIVSTIAPTETSPATSTHDEGDQFFWNGILYTATDDIAIGEALVVNTNIEVSDSITEQLAITAAELPYDNTQSGLVATNAQRAIDEIAGRPIIDNAARSRIGIINRKTRRQLSSTDLVALKTAITSGNFTDRDIKDGDYFSGNSGLKYTLGEFNHFYGNTTQNSVIHSNHYAIVVDCMGTTTWNSGGNATGAYKASTLRTYLRETALPKVLSDMQALGFNVLSRQCLESNAFDSTAVNRWGKATGCSSGWEFIAEQIVALSEPQVYGSVIAGSSFYDVGEANRQLSCFREHSFMDIADMKYFWLKEPGAASYACTAYGDYGSATGNRGITNPAAAFGLIIIN